MDNLKKCQVITMWFQLIFKVKFCTPYEKAIGTRSLTKLEERENKVAFMRLTQESIRKLSNLK